MVESALAWIGQSGDGFLVAQTASLGFFQQFSVDMKALFEQKQYFEILIDWRILVPALLVAAVGFYWKSKPILLTIFSLYGFVTVHHFSLSTSQEGGKIISEMDNLVVFLVGILAVAAVIIYFGFIKGD